MMKSKLCIVSFNGQEGSGKSTIAKMVAERLGLPHYYMGQIYRDMAADRNMTLPEFRKICDADPNFDNKLDAYVVELSQKHANFIIESRTAWHFIPDSFKVYLKVDIDVAAERIFKALSETHNRSNEDCKLDTVEDIKKSILQRRVEDNKRYLALYGIDQDDEKNYDLIVDTTNLSAREVFSMVLGFIESNNNEQSS